MATKTKRARRYPFEPDFAVPPGRTLSETIETQGIDQKELARRTGFTEKHISQIINGKAPISAEAAIRFEWVTGVPARIWNNLEAQYQEQKARLAAREQLQANLGWLKCVPVKELIKRGAIPDLRDPIELLTCVLQFFRVASVDAWRMGWQEPAAFAFRKSTAVAQQDGAIAAWLRLGELEAEARECGPYDEKRFRDVLTDIRALTTRDPKDFVPRMVELCAGAGVAVVFVPEIKGAPVSGAAKWITPKKAMICLNIRGKSNDRFWFTFFHEAGHVLKGSSREVFVDIDTMDDPEERAANEFAARLLIPSRHDAELPSLKSRVAVVRFARRIGIHPGIVVGRLQNDRILPHSHLNDLKVRFQWVEE